ncbi:MAG: HD-GYP domain-containing protein [Anaerovoracaceae bacterium]|nr:HD domain-containing protein [Anaerovoracaceae bacterium]
MRTNINFSKKFIERFMQDSNLKLAEICRIMIVVLAVVLVLNLSGVFVLGSVMYPVLLFSMAVMYLPTILYKYLHLKSDIYMYFVLSLIIFMSGLLYTFLSYHVILIFAFPLVISCLYCEKNCVIFTTGLIIPTLVISHFAAFYFHIVPDEPLVTIHGLVWYGIIPRIIELISIAVICYTIADKFQTLIASLVEKNNELYQDQQNMIFTLAQITELQSTETGTHVKRVSEYTRVLCEALDMDIEEITKVTTAAMMHDIGKMTVPREILEKPDKLTQEEYAVVKEHVTVGRDMLVNSPGELMQLSAIIAYHHHERWDGSGYLHLKGEDINLYARCVAIGDVFDALVTPRVYKEEWTPEEARKEILFQSGKQFDPNLVKLFDEHFDEFLEVYHKYPC